MRLYRIIALLLSVMTCHAQDSLYTRDIIKYLTSEKCYGRGYLKNGLSVAEQYLVSEIKKTAATGLFDNKFIQSFYHPVNTFPSHCDVTLNGKKLKPGINFIPDAGSPSLRGKFALEQKDSVTYLNTHGTPSVALIKKNKLTYTVEQKTGSQTVILLDKSLVTEEPRTLKINIKSKLVADFESRNIGCKIEGQRSKDSIIIFSAHYDHLGGIGKKTFFPGANDNASGVAMVLNLLRHYSAHPPKYTVVFLLFAGEEAGLLGSKFFVESQAIDLRKVKFMINLDLLGTGEEGIMVVNGALHVKEFQLLELINGQKNLLPSVKKRGKAANSDHYWFTEKGVPAFFIYTMGGIKAYHDVHDIEKTLPLTRFKEVFLLITTFITYF